MLLSRWAKATFILTLLVILAGGIVRTTQSGMGCPDWPKCFGMWVPPTNASQLPPDFEKYLKAQDIDHSFNVYHTWIEYVNRLFGALLGVFAVIQLGVAYVKRKRFNNPNIIKLAIAFLALVILTGLFGAIVVKLNLAHLSISVHLLFALLLTQIQLALIMNISGSIFKKTAGVKIRRMLVLLFIVVFVQAILGTNVRMYIDDVSKALNYQQREAWLADMPIIFLIHRTFSWAVLLFTLYCFWYCSKVAALKTTMSNILLLTLSIVTTGIVLFYLDMPAAAQPLHLLLAALLLTQITYGILYTKNTTDLMKK
jgi:heme a synthase